MLVLFTVSSIAFASSVAFAQPGGGRGGMDPEKQITQLIAQLDVTAEQEQGFREVMQQIGEIRMAGMRRGGGHQGGDQAQERVRPTQEEMMERQAQIQAEEENILATVLDAAQIEKYREIQQERMAKMMSRRNH